MQIKTFNKFSFNNCSCKLKNKKLNVNCKIKFINRNKQSQNN